MWFMVIAFGNKIGFFFICHNILLKYNTIIVKYYGITRIWLKFRINWFYKLKFV